MGQERGIPAAGSVGTTDHGVADLRRGTVGAVSCSDERMSDHYHCTPGVIAAAQGALRAQQVIEELKSGDVSADCAWLAFVELAARYGRASPACAAFVTTLAKRARAA